MVGGWGFQRTPRAGRRSVALRSSEGVEPGAVSPTKTRTSRRALKGRGDAGSGNTLAISSRPRPFRAPCGGTPFLLGLWKPQASFPCAFSAAHLPSRATRLVLRSELLSSSPCVAGFAERGRKVVWVAPIRRAIRPSTFALLSLPRPTPLELNAKAFKTAISCMLPSSTVTMQRVGVAATPGNAWRQSPWLRRKGCLRRP